jgi:hypothetical protein
MEKLVRKQSIRLTRFEMEMMEALWDMGAHRLDDF